MRFLILAAALILPLCQAADPLPPGGVDLVTDRSKVNVWPGKGGSSETVPVTGQAFSNAWRIKVATGSPDQPWGAQLNTLFTGGSVKNGDKLLLVYHARCLSDGSGLASAKVQLRQPAAPTVGTTGNAKFGAEWEQVTEPFIAKLDAPEGTGELVLFFGGQAQSVEIGGLRVINYGPDIDLNKLPRRRETYDGRKPDAPWRMAALARIEKLRKEDFSVKLTGPDGKPRPHTTVTLELDRHEFGFGSCVTRGMLTVDGPDGDRYRDIARRTFSRVVFENDLKPGLYPTDATGRAELEKSFAWLKANGISVRGHYLMQEAIDGWTRERLADPAKLEAELMASVRERIATVSDRVVEWDVINHPVAWQGAELLGQMGPPFDTLSLEVFREARRLTRLPLCINEDQIFRPGPQQDKTFELLEKLKRDGVRVDGLGNQAHFHASFLPSPDDLLKVTDRFTAVVPKQVITEFDIVTQGDDQLAADYLRDSLIACFSHPAYDGFLLWGFWEGSHWLPEAALWRKDWSARPIALVWEDWVGKRWHTRVTLTSDAAGNLNWRGFKGTYHIVTGTAAGAPFHPGSAGAPVTVKSP